MQRADRLMRNAAVDPDIDGVVALGCSLWESQFFGKIDIVQFEPNIGAAFRDEIGKFANYFRVENWFAVSRVKGRQRHAPTALSRDDPVGPRFDRARDPVLAP